MLFLPESIFEARKSLWSAHEAGDIPDEAFFQKSLELDPDDYIGMLGLGRLRRDAGDLAEATKYFWRAILAHPCLSYPYIEWSGTLHSDPAEDRLAIAVAELGLRKGDVDDIPLEKLSLDKAGFSRKLGKEFKKLPPRVQFELIVAALEANREDEPEAVTERMAPLRLIQDLQEELTLDRETVDKIIQQGEAIAPLLVGVLRDWAQNLLDEDSDPMMESALALLGETGSPANIPHILEFAELENAGAAGCAAWAMARIIERDTSGAAQTIESLAPEMGLGERMVVAEQILRYPALDPQGKLLQLFSENLNAWDRKDRDAFFPVLVTTMAISRKRQGIDMARGALMRQGGLLSRGTLRQCETLLADFLDADASPGPLPRSPFTVYEICAGEVPWEEIAEEKEEELDDEFLPPPAPIRRERNLGRNDPCWCKSGKKYKKCHLESDEKERHGRQGHEQVSGISPMKGEFDDLRNQLGQFLSQAAPQREMMRASAEFVGEDRDSDSLQMLLIDWLIHDWIVPRFGRTVLQQFLVQRGPQLGARAREIADAWSQRSVRLYEIQETKPGSGVGLKDILSGETLFVHDVNLSNQAARWDGLFARAVPGERGNELSSFAESVPRRNIEALREWMEKDRAEIGLAWPEYFKSNWPRIRRQSHAIADAQLDSLRLTNTDGEEFLISKAVYNLVDEEAALAALRRCAALEAESDGSFVWLNDEKTVLGRIGVERSRLVLECNSKKRLERGHELLAELAGNSLRHLRDEFTTQRQLLAQAKADSRDREPEKARRQSSVPKEVGDAVVTQYFEEHYRKWPDMKLPALGGKTPREAAKTPRGRKQLEALLKDFENGEDRKRQAGEVFYNVAKLRTELGM